MEPNLQLSLNPEIQQLIQRRIDAGLFADANAVIGDALRRTEPQDDSELRAFLAPRIAEAARGEFVPKSYDQVFTDILAGH